MKIKKLAKMKSMLIEQLKKGAVKKENGDVVKEVDEIVKSMQTKNSSPYGKKYFRRKL